MFLYPDMRLRSVQLKSMRLQSPQTTRLLTVLNFSEPTLYCLGDIARARLAFELKERSYF